MNEIELKVGDKRKFSFSEGDYIILEKIDNPNVYMEWVWSTGICPHCKRKIERTINHRFYNIEILAPINIEEQNIKSTDIIVMGHTTDNRYMQVPIDNTAYNQILALSNKFRKFLLEG